MIDAYHLGIRIADNRRRLTLTQNQLAEKLYVTPQAVSKWETGAAVPNIDILLKLSNLFGISVNELIEDDVLMERISKIPFDQKKDIVLFEEDKERFPQWASKVKNNNWVERNWITQKDNMVVSQLIEGMKEECPLIIELGIGPGGGFIPTWIRHIPRSRLIISDLSPTVIREWRRLLHDKLHYSGIYYAVLNHCSLPFVDECIDIVSDGGGIINTIEGTRKEAIFEAFRVLKKGGMLISGIGYISKEEEKQLPVELVKRIRTEHPEVFETMYEELTTAGFRKIESYITGGWDTDDDDSVIADIARQYNTNIHFTASIRMCIK